MNTATQKGAVSDPDLSQGELEVRENPRDVKIDAMTARMEKAREAELVQAMEGDAGLAHQQQSLDAAIEQSNQNAEKEGLLVRDPDGAASRQPMHPEQEPTAKPLPADLQNDPLAEYIVMQEGQPMFQTKVDGNIRLIPLDQARRELQIGTAAAARMNEATAIKQSLDDRERRLLAGEAALTARMNAARGQMQQPAAPATPQVPAGLTDQDLLQEAEEIFETAFTGTEADAAKKLARTLGKIRNTAATPAAQPQIDQRALVSATTRSVIQTIRKDERDKDAHEGYQSFRENYPDLMNDRVLYQMADNMTDEIAKENPSWPISQVMDEAGKRTRNWVNSLKGEQDTDPAPDPTPDPSPNFDAIQSTQTRQDRKAQLVRMPHAAPAAVHQENTGETEQEQSPLQALNELRASRGQPT